MFLRPVVVVVASLEVKHTLNIYRCQARCTKGTPDTKATTPGMRGTTGGSHATRYILMIPFSISDTYMGKTRGGGVLIYLLLA